MPRIAKENSLNFCPPYAKDIKTLLTNYLKHENCVSIKQFKEEWKKLKFSLIHQGKPEDVSGKIYLQELYCTCLGYFLLTDNLQLKLAVLYTLYFLYETQPLKPKEKINITVELFKELFELRKIAKEDLLVDAFQVLNALRQNSAFCFSAVVKIDPILSNLDSNLNGKFQLKPLESEISKPRTVDHLFDMDPCICDSYVKLKNELFSKVSNPTILSSALSILNQNFTQEIETSINLFTNEEANRKAAFIREVYSAQKSLPRVSKKSKLTTNSLLKTAKQRKQIKPAVTASTNGNELLQQIIHVDDNASEEALQELYQTAVKLEEDEVRTFGDGRAERRIDETPILQQQIQQELQKQEEEKKKGKRRKKNTTTTTASNVEPSSSSAPPKPVLTEQEQKELEKKKRAFKKQMRQLQNGDVDLSSLNSEPKPKKKSKKQKGNTEKGNDVRSIIDSFLREDLIDEDDLSPLSEEESQPSQSNTATVSSGSIPQQTEEETQPEKNYASKKKKPTSSSKKNVTTKNNTKSKSTTASFTTVAQVTVVEDEAVTSSSGAIMSEDALQQLVGGYIYSLIKQEEQE